MGVFNPPRWETFQFTPLREGRRVARGMLHMENLFQFTPLREGRPRCTPTTRSRRSYFNSRPSARGDSCRSYCGFWASNFNSRPSARGDSPSVDDSASALFQFTPLREGRPPQRPKMQSGCTNFNSRPSARGDFTKLAYKNLGQKFQFTPLREGRLVHGVCWGYWNLISIHAPPRGATGGYTPGRPFMTISIHAPPRGATATFVRLPPVNSISIHAPPRGATRGGTQGNLYSRISIHAPPRGATQRDEQ